MLSATKTCSLIKERRISTTEALEEVLGRIRDREEDLHCYITLDEEGARQQAKLIQNRIDVGSLKGPLAGAVVAVKDNICVRDLPATCGSKMLAGFIPPYDATVTKKLRDAGCIIIGKTNMDEFAMGSTCENSYFGPTKNPYDTSRVTGGSSGGSAAAVAAGEAMIALGSDTGGSIRLPAAYCGVVGLKPTYGRVSRYGLIAYASGLDQIGPMGRSVEDCGEMLSLLSGADSRDATSRQREAVDTGAALGRGVKGLTVGLAEDYLSLCPDEEAKNAVLEAAEKLRDAGAAVEHFSLGYEKYVVPIYYILADAQASSNLERYDGIKYGYRTPFEEGQDFGQLMARSRGEGFGSEVKRRILVGSFVLSAGWYDAYYKKALAAQALLRRCFDEAFSKYDLILMPAAPSVAPKLGVYKDDIIGAYRGDVFTVTANLAQLPAMSIPAGVNHDGLPLAVQLMADRFREDLLLAAGAELEKRGGHENDEGI